MRELKREEAENGVVDDGKPSRNCRLDRGLLRRGDDGGMFAGMERCRQMRCSQSPRRKREGWMFAVAIVIVVYIDGVIHDAATAAVSAGTMNGYWAQ
mmetsp:Transcript_11727/g.25366  ORF Transcript_11727/g.25366 Transcript_11727/m.25366 type:complete len:97 (-) Transcript_11727:21-311(-)